MSWSKSLNVKNHLLCGSNGTSYVYCCREHEKRRKGGYCRQRAKEKIWRKLFKRFSLEGDDLLWDGQRVPTQYKLDDAVRLVHMNDKGKHCMRVRTLLDALPGKNWAIPPFAGGCNKRVTSKYLLKLEKQA